MAPPGAPRPAPHSDGAVCFNFLNGIPEGGFVSSFTKAEGGKEEEESAVDSAVGSDVVCRRLNLSPPCYGVTGNLRTQ